MLYQGENPALRIIAVEHLHWGAGVFQVPPRDYASLTFRIRGEATIEYGEQTCFVNPGEVLYMPQNLGYTATYTDTELVTVNFVTHHPDTKPEVYSLENVEQLYTMFLRAHALWESKDPGCGVQVMSVLYGILGAICQAETSTKLPPHFLKAVSYINANFTGDITIDAVCQEAGISATVFRLLFKQYYQKTPVEYITQLRLAYARNLISGGMAVEQAALHSGFHDPKYFARTVKKHLGCTPRGLKNYGK